MGGWDWRLDGREIKVSGTVSVPGSGRSGRPVKRKGRRWSTKKVVHGGPKKEGKGSVAKSEE